MREKNSLYNEYRKKREKTKEFQTVKGNIEQILRREPGRGKGGGIMNGKRPYMDYRQHRAEQKSLKPLETKIPQKTAQKPE